MWFIDVGFRFVIYFFLHTYLDCKYRQRRLAYFSVFVAAVDIAFQSISMWFFKQLFKVLHLFEVFIETILI